jgi:hypothetical protein
MFPVLEDMNGDRVMNRKFLLAWLVVFVVWMVGSFVIHGLMLHDDYAQLPHLFRPEAEAQRHLPLEILAHVLMSGAFAWIYSRGVENRPWLPQGVRFGLAIALLTVVPTHLIYHVVQPIPGTTTVKQIVYDTILVLLLGILLASFYRPSRRA